MKLFLIGFAVGVVIGYGLIALMTTSKVSDAEGARAFYEWKSNKLQSELNELKEKING